MKFDLNTVRKFKFANMQLADVFAATGNRQGFEACKRAEQWARERIAKALGLTHATA